MDKQIDFLKKNICCEEYHIYELKGENYVLYYGRYR